MISLPFFITTAAYQPKRGSFWGLENPLNADSFTELLENIIDWITTIGILIAIIMIIYSGYLFMTSGGSDEKVSNAKKSLIWSLVGLAVLIMGKNFISLIKDILGTH